MNRQRLTSILGVLWAFFQLAVSSVVVLDAILVRSIHLAFALTLTYLLYPFGRSVRTANDQARPKKVSPTEVLLAMAACLVSLYLVLQYEPILSRHGNPNLLDLTAGFLLIALLLEGARRLLGPALPTIALLFCAYTFLRPYLPDVIAAKGTSLGRFITQTTLSSEGVFGIPLDVSARVVYLFVLFGTLLHVCGAGQFLTTLAIGLLGKYQGGPAKAAVLGSGMTGMLSGSSIANIVTTGTFTIPMMKKVGYPREKSAAIEVAASTDGQLAPPIMGAAAFIIAEYVSVPYIEVIRAAFLPALASYIALFGITHFEACKLNLKKIPKSELPSWKKTLKEGFVFLIPIGFLVWELVVLRRSPERAAFVGILITTLLILGREFLSAWRGKTPLVQAPLETAKLLRRAFVEGSRNMLSVALATATAGIIVAVVAMGLGGFVTQIVEFLAFGNLFLLLLITALASLLIGMGLPTTATYIVMASLTAPAIVSVSSDMGLVIPLIAAHLFCFYFGILADDTPPVGLAAYTAASIAKSHPIRTGLQAFSYDVRTAILPFMFVLNTDLLLYEITSPYLIVMTIVTVSVASLAFVAALQGWFVGRVSWLGRGLLLLVAFAGFRFDWVEENLQLPSRTLSYLLPLGLFGLIWSYQRFFNARKLRNQSPFTDGVP